MILVKGEVDEGLLVVYDGVDFNGVGLEELLQLRVVPLLPPHPLHHLVQ